jgi:putative hemolysin
MTPALAAILVIAVFAAASFFFSLAETSLFSLARWQARELEQKDARRGGILMRLLAEPQDLLATMSLGNTLAFSAILSTGLWMALQGRWSLAATLIVVFVVTLICCEVVPKTLAVRHPEKWALRVAYPMSLLEKITLPLRKVAQVLNTGLLRRTVALAVQPQTTLTEGDYQELIEMAYNQGTLAESEREIILQIINLDRRTAGDVMKPRSQMGAIPDDLSIEEMIAAARLHKHRRLPMYDETPDTIVGVLNTRALLLDPNIDLADAIEFPSFVPESMNLLQLLKSLQRQQRGLAIVLDEFGGTAGIVTMEDIFAEIIGRIRHEAEPGKFLIEKLGDGRWRVNGTLRIDDFRREYPGIGGVADMDTMGGLLTSLLDVVPAQGEFAEFRGLRLTAQSADERRVRELLVEVAR